MSGERNVPINYDAQPFSPVPSSKEKVPYRPAKCTLICTALVLVLAVVFLIFATVMPLIIQSIVHKQIEQQVPLQVNGSLTYSAWVSPPAPIYMQFWFFNVTNADAVVATGAKPYLNQVGPLTYLEKRQKVDIVFHEANGTVSYRELRTYHYMANMSAIQEDQNVTNINLPLIVLGNMVRSHLSVLHKWIEKIFQFFDKNGLFLTKTAAEVLWGYEDPALKSAASILSIFGIHIDPRVGIFTDKNGSDDGRYNVFTGRQKLSDFVHVHTWKDQERLSIWSTEGANRINGTDGTMFGPFLDSSVRQYIFASDLCRSIYVEYQEPTSVLDVPSYLYAAPASVFANVTENPDNEGFCIPNCLGSGLLNMSRCQPQAPAIMSQPHFYQADPKVAALVDGLTPSEDGRTEIVVEPMTGVVLHAKKKLQINMAIEPVPGFPDMEKLPPELILPYLWLNESALVDEASAAQMRDTLVMATRLSGSLRVAFNIIGGLLLAFVVLVIAVILFWWASSRRQQKGDRQSLVDDDDLNATPTATEA